MWDRRLSSPGAAAFFCTLLLTTFLAPARAEDTSKLYRASKVAFVAGGVADVASSLNTPVYLREANSHLRNSAGGYDTGKGVAFKAIASGGLLGVEWIVLRLAPKKDERTLQRAFSFINIGVGSGWSAIAVSNTARRR